MDELLRPISGQRPSSISLIYLRAIYFCLAKLVKLHPSDMVCFAIQCSLIVSLAFVNHAFYI